MTKHDTLTQALQQIADMADGPTLSLVMAPAIAAAALSATQPAQAASAAGMSLVPDHTLTPLQRTYLAQTQPAQAQQVAGEVVAWRDHVEQRIREWRCSTTNDDGDRVALEDFMSTHHVDDLIDYVCSAYTTPPHPRR